MELETGSVIFDLTVVVVSAFLVSALLARMRQPLVLGYLVAGVLVGPHVLSLVESVDTVNLFADLGIILLLFYLGLNFSLHKLRGLGIFLLLVGAGEMLLMVALGNLLGVLLGWSAGQALLLGAVLAFSSTAIIVKLLEEFGQMRHGLPRHQDPSRYIVGLLLVEDVGAVVLLTVIGGATTLGAVSVEQLAVTVAKMLGFFLVVLVLGFLLVPRLLEAVYRSSARGEALLLTGLGVCFGLASLSMLLGFSHALGAFMAGVLVAESGHRASVADRVLPVRDLFAAIFFLSIGMLLDPGALVLLLPAAIAIVAFRLLAKVFACGLGAYLWGLPGYGAILVGVGMVPVGEFSFVSARYAVDAGLADPSLYNLVVGSGLVTVVAAMPLLRGAEPMANGLGRLLPARLLGFGAYLVSWVQELREQMHRRAAARELVRRQVLDIGVNVLVIIVVIVAVTGLGDYLNSITPSWLDVSIISVVVAMLLSLPSLVVIFKNVRGLIRILKDLLERRYGTADRLGVQKALTNLILLAPMLLLSLLFIPTLASWLQSYGPPVLAVLAAAIAVTAVLSWRTISGFQSRLDEAVRRAVLRTEAVGGPPEGTCQVIELASPMQDERTRRLLCQIPVPSGSPAAGHSLARLGLEKKTGVSVLSLERGNESIPRPPRATVLQEGDILLVMGLDEQVGRAYELLQAGGSRGPRKAR